MQILDAALKRARSAPHAPALVSAEATLSWHEFIDTVARIATLLERQGVRRGHVVAVAQSFSPIMQAVLTAAIWFRAAASCSFTSRQLAEPPFRPDRIIAPDAGIDPSTESIVLDSAAFARLGALPPQQRPLEYDTADALCRLAFSSGTTGLPKAVPLTLSLIVRRTRQARESWIPDTPFMSLLGINSASGFLTFVDSLRSGSPYLIPGNAEQNFALLQAHGVRALKASPAQLGALAEVWVPEGLPRLRVIESAGSPLSSGLRARLEVLTEAKILNLYGSCEAGTVAVGERSDAALGLVGRVLDGVEMQAFDERGHKLPDGEEGQIRVRRAGQVGGYYEDPLASSEAFIDGWFVPGDYGYVRDGELYVRGRASEIINAGGVKASPSEIEATLEGFEGIGEVAVFGDPDEHGNTLIAVAYTVAPETGTNHGARLRRWQELAKAELGVIAPARWVRVAEIPRNENGKVLRQELVHVAARTPHAVER